VPLWQNTLLWFVANKRREENTMGRFVVRIGFCGGFLLGMFATLAAAQDWPTRNVTIVVPLAAGSASDITARAVAEQLGRQLNRGFVVENRPGAGGTTGASAVAKSAPDGYTLLAYGALATANALYPKLPYDTLNDFIPVMALGQQAQAIVGAPAKGYKTVGDLIAAGKAKPGSLNYSSAGAGSASHFAAERLLVSGGFKAQHIPFKGSADSLTEVIAGRVDFCILSLATTVPHIRDGSVAALAVSAHKRSALMPEVPTTIEAGLSPQSVYTFYTGLYLPAKTPREIVDKLHAEMTRALQVPEVQARFKTLGIEPMPMSVAEFGTFFRDEVSSTLAIAKAAGIKLE
jgi:tripartite-type tricarboxylate transporter receptor subunit TctC